jgi:bifunctional non-homologous end joining protein LigD
MSLPKLLKSLPPALPRFVEPMKCRLAATLPRGKEWVYEIKFDGYRGLAVKNKKEVRLLSRNNKDLGSKYPRIIEALQKLKCDQIVLDGEIVAVDSQGRSSFQSLQRAGEPGFSTAGLFYYVFDILNLNGRNTTDLPLLERKALTKIAIHNQSASIRFSDILPGNSEDLIAKMKYLGLEGLIAKTRDSKYEPGQRSGAWIKFKWAHEQEFVIGGYTDPEGSRPWFGSVLLGYYKDNKLIFAGKVGTGFNSKLLKSLYDKFQKIRTDKCPFANLPERGGGLTAAQMRFCKWVKPNLVCQVRFTEWTRDNHLRQPVFLGLREDKIPKEVVLEKPIAP